MGKFLVLFIIITVSEVYLMKIVAERTGFLLLLGIVMFTGFLGIALAKMQGRHFLHKIQEEISQGKVPGNPLVEGLMILVAAAVLITPGFITDLIGFSLLVPFVRKMLAPSIGGMLKPKQTGSSSFFTFQSHAGPTGQDQFTQQRDDFFDMPKEPEEQKKLEDSSN